MRIAVAIISVLFSLTACAQEGSSAKNFQEGKHYRVLANPVPVLDSNKIEVAEVFWYGCSHCFQFEPLVRRWQEKMPADVVFVHTPAMWNGIMETHARAFYTAKALGVLDKVHQPIFNAINIDRNPLQNENQIAALFAKHGVNKDDVLKTFNSFGVTSQVKQADSRARGYKISGTPTVVVNGTYVIETEGAGGHAGMLEVVDFLIKKIREES